LAITGPQCRAARALVEWPRDRVAQLAGIDAGILANFESGGSRPDDEILLRLQQALEEGGAVFLFEGDRGVGVRLKFTRKDVRAINAWESEGGPVGTDDV